MRSIVESISGRFIRALELRRLYCRNGVDFGPIKFGTADAVLEAMAEMNEWNWDVLEIRQDGARIGESTRIRKPDQI